MNENTYSLIEEADEKISSAISIVKKEYINNNNYEILPLSKEIQSLSIQNSIRILKINTIFFQEDENTSEKLSQILSSLHSLKSSFFIIADSNGLNCDIYLGIKDIEKVSNSFNTLKNSLLGNFPGSQFFCDYTGNNVEELINSITDEKNNYEISSILGIPSNRNKESISTIISGIEKLIYGMKGKKFTYISIADPLEIQEIETIKSNYEEIYSKFSVLKTTTVTLSNNTSDSINESEGETNTKTSGFSESSNNTKSSTNSTNDAKSRLSKGSKISKGILSVAAIATLPFSAPIGIGLSIAGNLTDGLFGGQDSEGSSYSTSTSSSFTKGTNFSESNSYQKTYGKSSTKGEGYTLQYNQENKKVINFLENLNKQIDRLKIGSSIGLWNVGTYFLSENPNDSIVAANIFSSNLKGEESDVEKFSIITHKNPENAIKIRDYLYNFSNPHIKIVDSFFSPNLVLASILSTDELAYQINLPKKSIIGLNIDTYVGFGVNLPVINENRLKLGNLYHLNQMTKQPFFLEIEKLKEHTLVVGTTGSGKSNTIYNILDELSSKNINFLVIEPTKGEYKEVFGGRHDVNVFGTNPDYAELLQINPFVFPKSIHVLEHIDRLIEIFNATWPLYAAMPAILKEAIEKSYEIKGWDLYTSKNIGDLDEFPSFYDLLKIIPKVINESDYSSELKGNYMGALVTRFKSLTNGLYGMIFSEIDYDNSKYFDENCIIDLSRIGSVETKSLIMGLLTLKLQEHRMHKNKSKNACLKHVTVIEEAHHLLKNSANTSGENAIQSKSVEMIINSIAEMRTYGEGFIIVDQSPTLLDQSVIKNTNTKIILRLPDYEDRIIVGKASNLSESQIKEIGRFNKGIATVYQSGWRETCLCSITPYLMENPYIHVKKEIQFIENNFKELILFLLNKRIGNESKITFDFDKVTNSLVYLKNIDLSHTSLVLIKNDIENYANNRDIFLWDEKNYADLSNCLLEIISYKKIFSYLEKIGNLEDWNNNCFRLIKKLYLIEEKEYMLSMIQCLLYALSLKDDNAKDFYFSWIDYIKKEITL